MFTPEKKYMQRAIALARHGEGGASPNPQVGAVIVGPDGRIIGEGYHRVVGQGHAEVNAIASVADTDRKLLSDSTMYVTLEPCSHYGRTPPCAKLIIDTGIPRVVIGTSDPFAKVHGRGIAMLREAGVEVITDFCAEECRAINPKFMTSHTLGRPFITLKWAQTADGFMASKTGRLHISTPVTQALMHRQRSLHDAILVGSETWLCDQPRLDVRAWAGRSPQRVVLDRRQRIHDNDDNLLIYNDYANLSEVISDLYSRGITSLLVEGGVKTLNAFINSGLYDHIRVEQSPNTIGEDGEVKAPQPVGDLVNAEVFDGNLISHYSRPEGTLR